MLECFFVLCIFLNFFFIVVKRICSGNFEKDLRKNSEEDSRTEGMEKGGGLRLYLIKFLFLFFSFIAFFI